MEKQEIDHKLELIKYNIDICNKIIKNYTDDWIRLNKEYVKLLEEATGDKQ